MNTRKLFYSFMALIVLVASAACTKNTADEGLYEQGVDKRTIVNGDKRTSIDKRTIVNGDSRNSVDKRTIVNGDSQ